MNWPMFHSWALVHGTAGSAVAVFAVASYLAMGKIPLFSRGARDRGGGGGAVTGSPTAAS